MHLDFRLWNGTRMKYSCKKDPSVEKRSLKLYWTGMKHDWQCWPDQSRNPPCLKPHSIRCFKLEIKMVAKFSDFLFWLKDCLSSVQLRTSQKNSRNEIRINRRARNSKIVNQDRKSDLTPNIKKCCSFATDRNFSDLFFTK